MNHRSANERAWLGAALLCAGVLLVILCAFESMTGIKGMPRFWYLNRPLWWLGAFGGVAAGSWLLAPQPEDRAVVRWRPARAGIRFQRILVYTRPGCHLCEEALELLAAYRRWLPDALEVNVDHDPRLVETYGNCVPVVVCDQKVRFRGKISPILLQRLIEGTPPL